MTWCHTTEQYHAAPMRNKARRVLQNTIASRETVRRFEALAELNFVTWLNRTTKQKLVYTELRSRVNFHFGTTFWKTSSIEKYCYESFLLEIPTQSRGSVQSCFNTFFKRTFERLIFILNNNKLLKHQENYCCVEHFNWIWKVSLYFVSRTWSAD